MKASAVLIAVFLAATVFAAEAPPGARQELKAVAAVVSNFLDRESAGLPGRVSVEVGRIDDRLALAACDRMQAFFPAGSRAWGQTSVGVRCNSPNAWTIYVSARVRVFADYVEAARPLAAGRAIEAGDIVVRQGELDRLPAGVLTDPSQAVGRRLANSIRAGLPIRRDAISEPPAVQQGQVVPLQVAGPGFRISSQGRTLGKAAEGKLVQVRTDSGSVVSGIVRPGPFVEILR